MSFQEDLLEKLFVYLDDIIVWSVDISDHLDRLETVLQKLQKHGLRVELDKCKFFQTEIKFLGHVISEQGVRTDPDKVQVVTDWPTPVTLRQVRSFLGFASYYRRFVEKFASIARPLYDLVSRCNENGGKRRSKTADISTLWNEECEHAFCSLKDKLTSTPTLTYPDFTRPFMLEVDASNFGLGAVLSQIQNGQLRVVAYASRGLRRPERQVGYSSEKIELLALKVGNM